MSHSAHFVSLYIAEHTWFKPKTEEFSVVNQNRARKTLILRQPIRIEHKKNPSTSSANQNRAQKKPFNFVSQSESSIRSPDSSANHNRVLRHPGGLGSGGGPFSALGLSRLAVAYLNN